MKERETQDLSAISDLEWSKEKAKEILDNPDVTQFFLFALDTRQSKTHHAAAADLFTLSAASVAAAKRAQGNF